MIVGTVALILILFGSGDSGMYGHLIANYTEDPIKITITDESRRELALKSLSVLKNDIEEFNKQSTQDIEKFAGLVKNFESQPRDFDSLFSTVISNRQEQLDKIWNDRNDMLSHIQPDEWQTIISSAKAEAQKK